MVMRKLWLVILIVGLLLLVFQHAMRGSSLVPPVSSAYAGFCPHYDDYPPIKVLAGHHAVAIAFGDQGSLTALDRDGVLWTYHQQESACEPDPLVRAAPLTASGPNKAKASRLVSIATSERHLAALTDDARPMRLWSKTGCDASKDYCGQMADMGLDHVVQFASAEKHSLALRDDGTVWGQGMGDCGQSGTDLSKVFKPVTALSHMVAVAAGASNSMALGSDGSVWQWGNLSNPEFAFKRSYQPMCRHGDYDLYGLRLSQWDNSIPARVEGLPPIRAISTFRNFDLALARDGSVWGWGYNMCGQLGIDARQLDDRRFYIARPVKIGGLPHIIGMAAGWRHALALDDDGAVWAWGSNEAVELGRRMVQVGLTGACFGREEYVPSGSGYATVPAKVPGIPRMVAVAAAVSASAAIDEQGDVWAWGLH
jgi:alpha-tubulin suppressor-like RCC1 family protein